MKLGQILRGLSHFDLRGDPALDIAGLTYDSREVKPGDLFVAIRGHHADGHRFIEKALEKGAVAVVAETLAGWEAKVATILVPDSRKALSKLALAFYAHPFKGITLIGITGTNGKTTTTYLLESIIKAAGGEPGVLGTVNYRYAEKKAPAPVTTPESLDLIRFTREMVNHGVTHLVMEVSSHALDQGRTQDCPFSVAVFTNLSRDHLDYHKTMDEYFEAKSRLFRELPVHHAGGKSSAVINLDDPRGRELAAMTKAAVFTYGLREKCAVSADSLQVDRKGLTFHLRTPVGEGKVQSHLIGDFNVYNILAAAAAGIALSFPFDAVVQGIEALKYVPGRLERVENRRGLTLVVDYSHTPDALLKAMTSLKPYVRHRLITVFGCGGDRDKGKRYDMGRLAGEHSDIAFITSDNPRSEDPLSIMKAIEKGMLDSGLEKARGNAHPKKGYFVEVDRRQAIRKAIAMARESDVVLIAGKGHEDYQIIGCEKKPFSDQEEAAQAAAEGAYMTADRVFMTAGDILTPIQGELLRGPKERSFSGISTDSRTVGAGQLFWALQGENFDGHGFVKEAIQKGAAGAVVNKNRPLDLPANSPAALLGVSDTLKALGDLAGWWRHRFKARLAAITGSTGKTTTKEMTFAILSLEGATLKNEGNFNNLIGLPLSLFQLQESHRYAVLEMGMNRPGEIRRLAEITDPDVGVITNVGRAHLEGVGGLEGVARAKVELLEKMSPHALAILNGDDATLMRAAGAFPTKPITFGQGPHNQVRAEKIRSLGREGFSFEVHWKGGSIPLRLRVPGLQNVHNALASAAIALSLSISEEHIREGLSGFEGIKGRFQVVSLGAGSTLIDDTYNANPSSLRAALQSLKTIAPKEGKVIVGLGDMLELGDETVAGHLEAGEMVAEANVDWFVALGDHAPEMIQGAIQNGYPAARAIRVKDHQEMATTIIEVMKPGDLVFLKASRRAKLEQVAERLMQNR